MTPEALYNDPSLVQFYDLDNGWYDDTRFCLGMARDGQRVLDLGCGTGLLAAALAERCRVTGVDPAAAMLDVARQRAGGDRVTWVEGDARTIRLGEVFDFVVMTGHAFQVFLTDADQRAVCETIAAHLAPGGTFIFDSREPAREEWRQWTPERSRHVIRHAELGEVETWNDVAQDPDTGIVAYDTFYLVPATGQSWQARSHIRFASRPDIAARIREAGLSVDRWLGEWDGTPHGERAREIIPIGSLA